MSLYKTMREPRDVGGFEMRGGDCRSETKESISIEWTRRNECSVDGGSGVGLTDSLVRMGK